MLLNLQFSVQCFVDHCLSFLTCLVTMVFTVLLRFTASGCLIAIFKPVSIYVEVCYNKVYTESRLKQCFAGATHGTCIQCHIPGFRFICPEPSDDDYINQKQGI